MHLQCPVLQLEIFNWRMMMNLDDPKSQLILGVDTHLDLHVGVLVKVLVKLSVPKSLRQAKEDISNY